LVEQIHPIGAQQWDQVQSRYNTQLPKGFPLRDLDALRRKYNFLRNVKKPTGKIYTGVQPNLY